ncbi:MAG: AAA family ATPase [Myxococcota bacterium]
MQRRFHLFARTHADGWVALSVLTHPEYAVVGRDLHAARAELADTLSRDLAVEHLKVGVTFWETLEVRHLEVSLRAVQHERLIVVPMRFLLCVHPAGEGDDDRYTVRVPRLDLVFSLVGRDDLDDWATEQIRGQLHLADVRQLLALRAARRERVEALEVRWHGPGRHLKQLKAQRVVAAAEAAASAGPSLGGVGVDLVVEARHGRIPRALARTDEVNRLIETLGRPHQRSALLVGAPGVGKTALVHELAHRVAAGTVPARLRDASVWWVSGNRLMAGMRYLGEWQQRALGIARTLTATGDVLYVGDLVELLQAGSGRGGLNAGQLFLPFLDRDAFPLVAEATPAALVQAEQLHAGFVRALRRLELEGMARDRALEVLEVLARRIAKEGAAGTEVTAEALSAALELLVRYGGSEGLPGAGLPLLERMIKAHPGERLARRHAVAAFSAGTGLPEAVVDPDASLDEAAVHAHFSGRIVGQEPPVRLLTELVLVIKAGLTDPGRPMASLLLLGPTGVGKTESAKALAGWLYGGGQGDGGDRLVRFDMSEFGGLGAARRLVDGPGGQGLLTRRVREQPYCVLLFDEIEKAEPAVFDVLLQVLGEGRLTDGTGVTVSFRHAVVLLTSNLGAGDRPSVGLRGADADAHALRYRRAAEGFFRPEFVNRLDAIVPYAALDADAVRRIGRGLLDRALQREGLLRRGVAVGWGDDVLDHVVAVGFDPRHGARPMKRAIEVEVLAPLSRVLARGGHADRLRLVVRGGRVEVEGYASSSSPPTGSG